MKIHPGCVAKIVNWANRVNGNIVIVGEYIGTMPEATDRKNLWAIDAPMYYMTGNPHNMLSEEYLEIIQPANMPEGIEGFE